MTAIRATFSDFKLIRGRKVAQIVLEVPIEEADAALRRLGGVPRPDTEQWVGIAPLTRESAEKPRKLWNEMPMAQQAGVLCGDSNFWRFLERRDEDRWAHCRKDYADATGAAAEWVRRECDVPSRADLDASARAGQKWKALVAEYRASR